MPNRRKKGSLTCIFPGCLKYRRSKGLCITHYTQQWAGKELTPVRSHARGLTPKIRFDRLWRYNKETKCWDWEGAIHPQKGYGMFWFNAVVKNMYAHRAAWVLYNGDIEEDPNHAYRTFGVLHTCDNPACVNPEHLFLGTHKDNMQDASRKGRFAVERPARQGERNARAKVTEDIVREIRRSTASLSALGRQYGISAATVGNIQRRETWKHVLDKD
jgi:HNH endonuclease